MTKRTLTHVSVSCVLASVALSSGVSHADCMNERADSDKVLWSAFRNVCGAPDGEDSCETDYVNWHGKSYYMYRDDFESRGWEDPMSMFLPYGKHWLSTTLIEFGVSDAIPVYYYDPGTGRTSYLSIGRTAFHTSKYDYGPNSRGLPPPGYLTRINSIGQPQVTGRTPALDWHDEFYSRYDDDVFAPGEGYWGLYEPGNILSFLAGDDTDTVTTFCLAYNPPVGEAVQRAVTLVHEAWHARENFNGWEGHADGPTGKCTRGDCDHFYAGDVKGAGATDRYGGALLRYRASAYQMELEFACDLTDSAQDWVPVESMAIADAMAFAAATRHNFSNIDFPPYSCGIPTPLKGMKVGSAFCRAEDRISTLGTGTICYTDGDCSISTETCSERHCCEQEPDIIIK